VRYYEKDIPEIAADIFEKGRSIINYGNIPPNSASHLTNKGVVASAVFAVYIQNKLFGFQCFEELVKKRHWDDDTINFLENITQLVSTALLRKKNEAFIQNMALTDQLTGLGNRHLLESRLTEAIYSAQMSGTSGYMLFIDLDDFKSINDGYGHDYGDIILREFAAFLKRDFSDIAGVFRFSGDEFVLLLQPGHTVDVHTVIDAVLARAQLPWGVIDKSLYCTLSIGIATFPEGSTNNQDLIKSASNATYQAKRMGKNNYVFYSSSLDDESVSRAEIGREMHESINHQFSGFSVVYQPLADTGKNIIAAEALMRWKLSTGHIISPSQFIPIAESLGLIVPAGEMVLREAAAFCHEINKTHPDFRVSVNVSIRQFQQRDFMEHVLSILEETGVNPSSITLEITESMAMQDIQRVKTLSETFRKLGMSISLDDFGVGHSSLGNMRKLPIDIIKIDKTFVSDVTTDPYSKSFIRMITELSHSMGRKVCIEGIETSEQFEYCRECNADYVQGYFIYPPLLPEQLRELLSENENTGKTFSPN
jgi:diguanylate cyclase (GGDEF)-like protein